MAEVITACSAGEAGLSSRPRIADRLLEAVCLGALVIVAATLFVIAAYVLREGAPAFHGIGWLELLFSNDWAPLAEPPRFGLRHALVSTLAVSVIALAVAVPLGIGCALFLVEILPAVWSNPLQSLIELLAGIPSVVYGFFGYVTLIPWFERRFGMPAGESLLAAGLILGVMCLPFIANMAAEAFRAVDRVYREGALALGVSRWYFVRRILLVKSMPGLFGAVSLGLARALGETLAVLMLAGNSMALPTGLLDRGQPITALIATEIGEAGLGSMKYAALMAAGLVLMLVVSVIHGVVWILKRHMQDTLYERA